MWVGGGHNIDFMIKNKRTSIIIYFPPLWTGCTAGKVGKMLEFGKKLLMWRRQGARATSYVKFTMNYSLSLSLSVTVYTLYIYLQLDVRWKIKTNLLKHQSMEIFWHVCVFADHTRKYTPYQDLKACLRICCWGAGVRARREFLRCVYV